MMSNYIGSELEVFAGAINWKSYLACQIKPHLGSRVLEVGAGIGSNIPYLCCGAVEYWAALEPDRVLARQIGERVDPSLRSRCEVITGTLSALEGSPLFDTILYIDVLEHISEDAKELDAALRYLAPAGRLIVVAPAHQYLFSSFDAAVGHHRRYSMRSLAAAGPTECRLISIRMLDSLGLFASLANRLLLHSAAPSRRQIAFWDKALVPASRIADQLLGYRFGKTVMAVWIRTH